MSFYDKASLILIPSGTKEGVCFSQKPTNGDGDFTFTRVSSATRVNEQGLIEKERSNIVIDSSNQSNISAFGIRNNIDSVIAVANPLTSQNNAYKITSNGPSDPYFGCNITSNLINGVNTFSCWLWTDSGQNTEATLFIYNADISEIQTKSITLTTTPTRYEVFANISDFKGNATLRVDLCQTCGITYLYTYGWQLEQGLVATEYIETTTTAVYEGITDNIPRLDYTDASCPSLLLEPQRTNVVPHSEYLLGYSKSAGTTITQNYGISPEGVQNSTRIQFSGTDYVNFGIATFTNEVTSMYVKGIAGEILRFGKGANVAQGALYTLTGDWQRIVYDVGSASSSFIISNYNGANATDFEVYGLQHEEGSYPTSYIPTYGASVTFAKDVCKKTSASDLIGQTEGTIFVDLTFDGIISENRQIFQLSDGSTNNLHFRIRNSNDLQAYGTGNFSPFDKRLALTEDGRYKMALGYSNGDFAYYVNGVQIATDTQSTAASNLSEIYLGINNLSITPLGGQVTDAFLFKTRLSNEELADLTTI